MDITTILLNSSSNELLFLAFPPAAASAVYYFIWRYYRNPHQRYKYEAETVTTVSNQQAYDQFFQNRKGMKNKDIKGKNSHTHTKRLQQAYVAVADNPPAPEQPIPPATPGNPLP